MRGRASISICVLSISLAACAYRPEEVADPNNITLRAAVFDVADTLHEVRERARYRPKTGMIADEATVVFNISAKSNETSGLKLDGSLPANVGLPLSFSSQYQLANEGSRGNQITLKFKNVVTAGLLPKGPAAGKGASKGASSSAGSGGGTSTPSIPIIDPICFKPDPPPTCIVLFRRVIPLDTLKKLQPDV